MAYWMIDKMRDVSIEASIHSIWAVTVIVVQVEEVCPTFGIIYLSSSLRLFIGDYLTQWEIIHFI